jgi:hypothetical protein
LELADDFLVWSRGGGRLSDKGDAVYDLISIAGRPGEVIRTRMMAPVATAIAICIIRWLSRRYDRRATMVGAGIEV